MPTSKACARKTCIGSPQAKGATAFDDDADVDGIKNGIENYFGTHPDEFSQGIVAQATNGNVFTFSHRFKPIFYYDQFERPFV